MLVDSLSNETYSAGISKLVPIGRYILGQKICLNHKRIALCLRCACVEICECVEVAPRWLTNKSFVDPPCDAMLLARSTGITTIETAHDYIADTRHQYRSCVCEMLNIGQLNLLAVEKYLKS